MPGVIYRQLGVKLWGEGAYERESIDGAATKYATLSRVEANDIIVNKIWARNGSVAVVQPVLAGCFVSGEFPTFMANPDLLIPRWIHWLTKTPNFWEQCDEKSRGTSGKNRIKPEQFLKVEIPLPPLAEQRRIVARIEDLAAKIAEACSLRRQACNETEALYSSTISTLSGSTRWPTRTVGQIVGEASLRNGRSVKASSDDGAVRCLMLSAMRHGRIDIRQSKPVPLTLDEAQAYLVRQGDVYVMRGNGSKELCGQAGLVEEKCDNVIFPDLFIRVPLAETGILPEFFIAFWNAGPVRGVIEDKAKTTSGIWKVNQGHIASTPIPIPDPSDQRRIIAYLHSIQDRVDELKRLQADTAAELDALLPAILDRAFKGEL
jgi:type I restriction enzyme S subunit